MDGFDISSSFFKALPFFAIFNREKDNRLGVLRSQGGYLYDKGENDELFHVVGYAQPIYEYILACKNKKVKKKIKKFFFDKKG
ncbi:MAG: hypothetical protein IJX31_01070 [Clostridia bacterium]|nr:hypothetical protein [Clostridia bacterium]